MIRLGKVVAIDEAKAKVRVQIEDADQVVTFWLPVLQQKAQDDKFYHLPDIGELVVCGFYSDDWDTGIVLGSIYNEIDLPSVSSKDKVHIRFKDGTEIEYDRAEHKYRVYVEDGEIEIIAKKKVTIKAPIIRMQGFSPSDIAFEGDFRIFGNVYVEGDIHATGTIVDEGGNTNHHSH